MLIVEDNFFNLIAVQGIVNQFGMKSDTTSDGLSALELIKVKFEGSEGTYKLIMMDYAMPAI